LKIISPEYAAPDGAKNIFDFRFYKYVAPRALDFQNSFSIHNCAFIVFAISTAIMYF